MATINSNVRDYLLIFLFSWWIILLSLSSCTAKDGSTITITTYINDQQTLTSTGEKFQLGFFDFNSTNRFIGIWYKTTPGQKAVVWVANRKNPVNDSSGVLRIAQDGNLAVMDGRGTILWTTNISDIPVNNSYAELLNTGNLVLRQKTDKQNILWQSFEDPSSIFLPSMKLGSNRKTGKILELRSWKGVSDPSDGDFTAGLELTDVPQVVIRNGSQRHWRSGPWNNRVFIGIADMDSIYGDGFSITRDPAEDTVYMTYNYFNITFVMHVLSVTGVLYQLRQDGIDTGWYVSFSTKLQGECDVYGKCGTFGSCNILESPICSCLRGFTPKYKDDWSKGNWSGGCVRRSELQCQRNNTISNITNGEDKKDGFLKLGQMKVPDFSYRQDDPRDASSCEQECLKNCSCLAFSYDSGAGCLTFGGNLIDIQKFSEGGADLFLRVAYTELDADVKKKLSEKVIIIVVLVVTFSAGVCIYLFWSWTKYKRRKQKKDMENSVIKDNPDLIVFKYKKLAIATNNFSEFDKLGEGGFGPVYKGKLVDDGLEIAVKRLSKGSAQGTEEFKNEVGVISKLQHRNLVGLLGCCAEGEEKMLVYEYMPNKSLDAFLFDSTKRALLDWKKREQIIEGVSRGILYLHRDSRLKVIHRDLKASNILLDEDLNPKISDFGMARIFGGNEMQAETRRVVGTYGYMPPEYLTEGRFSEKSDVFSFGVLLLEIVSGRRNACFYHQDLWVNLLGYAWHLWNENEIRLLIDQTMLSDLLLFEQEIMRCIHVGLLCVQEWSKDRPTMATTLSMLTSEITNLPNPKQPAFAERRDSPDSTSNSLTVTSIGGR